MKIIQQKGFTLIELIVTLVILSLISMIAAPAFIKMRDSQNFNRSIQELVSTFNSARSKAALDRKNVEVILESTYKKNLNTDTSTQFYWMPYGDAFLKSSIKNITFSSNGGVYQASGNTVFTICKDPKSGVAKTISISIMGTAQITEGTC